MQNAGGRGGDAGVLVADAAPYLQSWLRVQRQQHRLPGLQAAIRIGDRQVLSMADGLADEAAGEALTTDHRFRVASQSKWLAATAVLHLAQTGRLALDDAVGRWLPALTNTAPHAAAATITQLLAHTSGISRDRNDSDHWVLAAPFPTADDVLANAGHRRPAADGTSAFAYSNTGYGVLGLLIEAVTDEPFISYMQRELIDRLDLRHTTTDVTAATGPLVTGHGTLLPDRDARDRLPADAVSTASLAPAAGLVSTAEDLTRWGASWWDGTGLLSATSLQLQRTGHSDGYGLGVELHTVGAHETVGHLGAWPGQISRTFVDPAAQLAISVCTNAADGPADPIARGLLALVDLVLAGPGRAGADAALEVDEGWRAGRFANLWHVVDVVWLGGRPLLIYPAAPDPGSAHQELSLRDGVLRSAGPAGFGSDSDVVEQERGDDGAVTAVRIGGVTHRPVRSVSGF